MGGTVLAVVFGSRDVLREKGNAHLPCGQALLPLPADPIARLSMSVPPRNRSTAGGVSGGGIPLEMGQGVGAMLDSSRWK